jgi:pantetheine-phosphate adenylyltransferase
MGRLIRMREFAIYPGTFDPITNGHVDIIKRARDIFGKVIIAIAVSERKNPMFSIEERVAMVKIATGEIDNIEVVSFSGLLVSCCQDYGIKTIVRGLRVASDFEYELQIGYANTSLDKEIDTVYLMPSLKNAFISSTIVRDIIRHDGNVMHLVPKSIEKFLKK